MDQNTSRWTRLVVTLFLGITVLAGCSSAGDSEANPARDVEEVEAPPETLAFTDESDDNGSSEVGDVDPVAVEDVFLGAGANEALAECYADAFAEVGVSDVTSFEELAQVQRDNDISAAINGCVDIANSGQ